MYLFSKVPGLCIGPLLVVSACIACLPPNLHTLLGFLPSGVWRAVLLFRRTPVGPSVCTEGVWYYFAPTLFIFCT